MTQSQSLVGGMFLCGGCHRYKTQLCIWQVSDVELEVTMDFFFPRSLRLKNKVKISVPLQCIPVWLTFSSFIPALPSSPCTFLPLAGRRMTRRAYGRSRACKPKFQFCFEGWENHLLYHFSFITYKCYWVNNVLTQWIPVSLIKLCGKVLKENTLKC